MGFLFFKNKNNKYLKNKNKLLNTLEGCIGVKTGFTDDAGRCLVSAIERDGMRVVCVVLNCGPMFAESAELLGNCADSFKLYDLTKLYNFNHKIAVQNGKDDSVGIGTKESFVYPLTQKELESLKFEYTFPQIVQAPLKQDSEIGDVKIFLNNNLLFSEKIFTIDNVKPKTVLQRMKDFFGNW